MVYKDSILEVIHTTVGILSGFRKYSGFINICDVISNVGKKQQKHAFKSTMPSTVVSIPLSSYQLNEYIVHTFFFSILCHN